MPEENENKNTFPDLKKIHNNIVDKKVKLNEQIFQLKC